MNAQVQALADELDRLRQKLMATPATEPGFREMRQLCNRLTDDLIEVGDRVDQDIGQRIAATATQVAEEWERNKAKVGNWAAIFRSVVGAVGQVTMLAGIPNPLARLLPSPG